MTELSSPEVASLKVGRRAATPVAGAIAGIIFAALFTASMTVLRQSMGDVVHDAGAWLTSQTRKAMRELTAKPPHWTRSATAASTFLAGGPIQYDVGRPEAWLRRGCSLI
jgi:hypothetical protein